MNNVVAMLCCTLSTTVVNNHSSVHSCSRSTTIVQSLLTTINQLFSSTIVSSCSNNIVTTILFSVNIEQLLIEQYSSTLSIQQVLLNLDNNIVQALFNERCINLINFCACTLDFVLRLPSVILVIIFKKYHGPSANHNKQSQRHNILVSGVNAMIKHRVYSTWYQPLISRSQSMHNFQSVFAPQSLFLQ